MLFDGCRYESDEKVWIWETGDNSIYLDPGTVVKLRIEQENWNNQSDASSTSKSDNPDIQAMADVPYSIVASMAESGLGGVEWW